MPFYRFEGMESHRFNPHLSSAVGPLIEGDYLYFRLVTKAAGTGARMHYHPNELMAFPLEGKVNCCVGSTRRVVTPGTLVHMPPFAQHEFFATDDGDLRYLYIKDRTWTLIGAAADEALPEKPLSATEVRRRIDDGHYPGGEKAPAQSQAIVDGLGECYYPMVERFDAPGASGHHEQWLEGTHFAFGVAASPRGREVSVECAPHELFLYVLDGALAAETAGEGREMTVGDVLHVPRGASYRWRVPGDAGVRYAAVRSLPRLEVAVDEHGAADNWRG